MKKLCMTALILMVLFVPLKGQEFKGEEEMELNEMVIGTIPIDSLSTHAPSHPEVKALCVGLANFFPTHVDWAILDFATQWSNAQDWNVLFIVCNYGYQDAPIKVELEMMYKDGGVRLYKKFNKKIESGYIMLYYLNVTSRIKNKGLFTLNGRVSGNGLGNSNEVKTQVFIY